MERETKTETVPETATGTAMERETKTGTVPKPSTGTAMERETKTGTVPETATGTAMERETKTGTVAETATGMATGAMMVAEMGRDLQSLEVPFARHRQHYFRARAREGRRPDAALRHRAGLALADLALSGSTAVEGRRDRHPPTQPNREA